jgi:hypothetical protein
MWNLLAEGTFFFNQILLKLTLTHVEGNPGDNHPKMNEWGGAWAISSRMSVVCGIPGQHTLSPNFSNFYSASNFPSEKMF